MVRSMPKTRNVLFDEIAFRFVTPVGHRRLDTGFAGQVKEALGELLKRKAVGMMEGNLWTHAEEFPVFAELREEMGHAAHDLVKTINPAIRLRTRRAWPVFQKTSDSVFPHNHSETLVATVFYADVHERHPPLFLMDPRGGVNWFSEKLGDGNLESGAYQTLQPVPGSLISFPAYVNHFVPANNTDDTRICVASNWNWDDGPV